MKKNYTQNSVKLGSGYELSGSYYLKYIQLWMQFLLDWSDIFNPLLLQRPNNGQRMILVGYRFFIHYHPL